MTKPYLWGQPFSSLSLCQPFSWCCGGGHVHVLRALSNFWALLVKAYTPVTSTLDFRPLVTGSTGGFDGPCPCCLVSKCMMVEDFPPLFPFHTRAHNEMGDLIYFFFFPASGYIQFTSGFVVQITNWLNPILLSDLFLGVIKKALSFLLILNKLVSSEQRQILIIRELRALQLGCIDWSDGSFSWKKLQHKNNHLVRCML